MDLVLSAMGMVSSVGRDAVTTCASIRAGLTRPAPVPGVTTLEPETNEVVPIRGHPITSITDGFSATARWLRMAPLAFADLLRAGHLPPVDTAAFWQTTGVVLVTPELEGDRFYYDPQCQSAAIEASYATPFLRRVGLSPESTQCMVLPMGRTGPFYVIAEWASLLATLKASRLVVLAVDSLLDGMSLDWLGQERRLKTDEHPVGLMPGEAAVALLIEEGRQAAHRRASVLAGFSACVLEQEAHHYDTEELNTGRALAAALSTCVAATGLPGPYHGDLFVDLNGETWRAKEYGGALAQLPPTVLGDIRSHYGAVSVGDTGAGAGALHLALAGRALARGYARGDVAMAACSSEDGRIGVCALKKYR